METNRLPEDEKRLLELLRWRQLQRLVEMNPIFLKSVESTQEIATEQLKTEREGDLVIAREQTGGRGREGRRWHSQGGGLWMTITLAPPRPEILEGIALLATSAILNLLIARGLPECFVKPPNDVYCGARKIAGVLADATVTGEKSIVYLGIGINVNNDPTSIKEISDTATSMKIVTGRTFDLIELAADLLESLDLGYSRALETTS